MKKIAIIGSINMDIVSSVMQFPEPGETVKGLEFRTCPGGKGANQAVAAKRLGADVVMFGKVGDDIYGKQALQVLENSGVDIRHVETCQGVNTGIAVIHVNKEGENYIVIQEGANKHVDIDYIKKIQPFLDTCGLVLLQLEIPMETVKRAAQYCAEQGIEVILDPAPAAPCDGQLLRCTDFITPNEGELKKIACEDDMEKGARKLLDAGVKNVIKKAGAKGCYFINRDRMDYIAGFKVKAADTTGAGDSFNAGFAVARAKGYEDRKALEYANAVGALAVTKMGAQDSMPTHKEVEFFMNDLKRGRGI